MLAYQTQYVKNVRQIAALRDLCSVEGLSFADWYQQRQQAEDRLAELRQENLKKLKQKEAELTRNARTHRLCTHGAMLEQYLSPEEFTTEQIETILKALFRRSDNLEMIQSVKRQAESQSETQ